MRPLFWKKEWPKNQKNSDHPVGICTSKARYFDGSVAEHPVCTIFGWLMWLCHTAPIEKLHISGVGQHRNFF
jgi:hypothetical protein